MATRQRRNPGVEEKIQATVDHVRHGVCATCGAPVLRARAGRVAALDVTADPEPINPVQEIHALLAGRLAWHLVTNSLGQQRITWRTPEDIRAGPKPNRLVIADHICPPQPVQETLL